MSVELCIDLIRRLSEGYSVFNKTKQKTFTNDDNLKAIYEFKNFKQDILYRYMGSYQVVTRVYLKKTNVDTKRKIPKLKHL